MKTYTCKQSAHDFTPNPFPRPYLFPVRCEVRFRLDASCWYTRDQLGSRWRAWKKIKGLTGALSWNNSNSVMFAYRSTEVENLFELSAYVNYPGKKITAVPLGTFAAGEEQVGEIAFARTAAVFMWKNIEPVLIDFRRPWLMREIGPWFDSIAPAPHEMKMQAQLTLK
jgi:hypothetical protein